ncbi:MAG: ABC transporter permease [Eubacteriales bacterium]|nr:ABC transporter permease [Eubacteriales bacterium]
MENKIKKRREPLIHISKRISVAAWKAWLIRLGAFLGALTFIALFVYLIFGINPSDLYSTMFKGAFVGKNYLIPTLKAAAKLLCIAVALAPAFKMRFWNIGAEGQMLAGAMAAAFVMREYSAMPNWLLLLVMCLFSIIAGGIWGLIPAVFKAKFGTNETLFTLMMNYIAAKIVDYFYNIWRGAKSALGLINGNVLQKDIYEKGYLRYFWSGKNDSVWYKSEDTWYIIIIGIIAILMYVYLKKTKQGYEIAVVGDSQNTARYAGISVNKVIIRTMIISGAICGLCGFMTVSFQSHSISSEIAGGYGFTAIIVAWMSRMNTLAMAGVSVLVIALENGSQAVANAYSTSTGFPSSTASIIVSVFLMFIIGSEFFINYKINFRHISAKEVA